MPTPDQIVSFFGTQGLTSETLYMNLCTNDVTINADTVSGSLTVASGGGYAQKTIAGTSWTGTVATAEHCTVTLPEQVFTFTGSVGVVYGWAITEGAGLTGDLVAVGKFNQGQMIGDNGDAIAVSLTGDTWIVGPVAGGEPEVDQSFNSSDNSLLLYNTGTAGQTITAGYSGTVDVYSISVRGVAYTGGSGQLVARFGTTANLSSAYLGQTTAQDIIYDDSYHTYELLFPEGSRPSQTQNDTYFITVINTGTGIEDAIDILIHGTGTYSGGEHYQGASTPHDVTDGAIEGFDMWFTTKVIP